METKKRNEQELYNLVRALSWNDAFGCFTRPGMEKLAWPDIADRAEWIVYFDVDFMHKINEENHGYDFADSVIKNVLGQIRINDLAAGQWKSGDEFIIVMTRTEDRESIDSAGLIRRLTDAFTRWNMSATFAAVPVISKVLAVNVQPAIDEVYKIKNARGDLR